MLMPKRTRYRRPHRLGYEGRAKAGREISFGEYGLIADIGAYISNRQIEAARIAMTRYMKRDGKIWIRIFPHMARTRKPLEVRMGSDKSAPEGWVAIVKPDRVMLGIAGVPKEVARETFRLTARKLSVRARFVVRRGGK